MCKVACLYKCLIFDLFEFLLKPFRKIFFNYFSMLEIYKLNTHKALCFFLCTLFKYLWFFSCRHPRHSGKYWCPAGPSGGRFQFESDTTVTARLQPIAFTHRTRTQRYVAHIVTGRFWFAHGAHIARITREFAQGVARLARLPHQIGATRSWR